MPWLPPTMMKYFYNYFPEFENDTNFSLDNIMRSSTTYVLNVDDNAPLRACDTCRRTADDPGKIMGR